MLELEKRKTNLFIPTLYVAYELPQNPNEYSVYIPYNDNSIKPQIYINGEWKPFAVTQIDEPKEKDTGENRAISDKEYNLIKAIREYMKEEEKC